MKVIGERAENSLFSDRISDGGRTFFFLAT